MPLPFFLLMTLAVVLILGGLLFLMYSIIMTVALESAMVFLLVFAASWICFGLGLLSLNGFFAYGKYYKKFKNGTLDKVQKTPQNEKTFKDYITLQNVALVVLLVAAICAIVSAALGTINRDKWVQARAPYMAKLGYYADVEYRDYKYTAGATGDVNEIVVDLSGKNAVVIYTDDAQKQGFVIVNGYEKYIGQIQIVRSGKTLTIAEGEKPSLDGALEKLLFFMFGENEIEKQIKIYVPSNLKDTVTVKGEYVLAKE